MDSSVRYLVMTRSSLLALVLALAALGAVAPMATAGEQVQVRQKDGSRWRGEIGAAVEVTYLKGGGQVTISGTLKEVKEQYILLDAVIAGRSVPTPVFVADILNIQTTAEPTTKTDETAPQATTPRVVDAATPTTVSTSSRPATGRDAYDDRTPGVFVLPMRGGVGIEFRHEQVEQLVEEVDKYGPGQIIVFEVDSPGGMVTEGEQFADLLPKIKKRHRLIAWIEYAISGGCAFSILCDEIYFRTEGTAGSVTMFKGVDNSSAKGEELAEWMRRLGDWFEEGGRSRLIAQAMIHAPVLLSYDKDPETGIVTFYPSLDGEFHLSGPEENLTFNASNALHCGFSDGTADTYEEMAALLDLPVRPDGTRWHEKSDIGRKIAGDWTKTVEQAQDEIPKIFARYEYQKSAQGDPVIFMGNRIRLLEQLVRWWDRCEIVCLMSGVPPKEQLEREIRELRKQIADIRRDRN